MLGFSFAPNWSREWRKFSGPITGQSKGKLKPAIPDYEHENKTILFSLTLEILLPRNWKLCPQTLWKYESRNPGLLKIPETTNKFEIFARSNVNSIACVYYSTIFIALKRTRAWIMMLEGSVCMQNRKTAAFSIKNNKKHRETSGQNWAKIGILLLLTITHPLTHSSLRHTCDGLASYFIGGSSHKKKIIFKY